VSESGRPGDPQQVFETLRSLRGAPRDAAYWAALCAGLAALCRARAVLALRAADDGSGGWRLLGGHPAGDASLAAQAPARLAELAPRALAQGQAYTPDAQGQIVAAVRLVDPDGTTLALMEIPGRERAAINDLLVRAQLVADLPAGTALAPAGGGAGAAAAADSRALVPAQPGVGLVDLVARVMKETQFGAASLALVNLLAAELKCDQVVLGVGEHGQVRVEAISHIDRFERKAENVQLLEAALEEALDQHGDLVFPLPPDSPAISLAHDRLARMMGYGHLATLVVRDDESPQRPPMALMLGRREGGFDATVLHQVSVAMHLLHPWLATLRERSQGLVRRSWGRLRHGLREGLSPERPGRKLLALAALLFVLGISFGTWPYRLEAPAELSTDSVQVVSAPFEGYLRQVNANLGDAVRAGTVLAQLDTRELTLQAADLASELGRHEAEADRARALGQAAETQIALARAAQARARLERVQFQLRQSEVLAPFDGVVVEGERRELAGTPVRQGDKLFRLARVEGLYVVIHVAERDIRELPAQARGRLRLLSQPDREIGFSVETLVPIAQVRGAQGGQFHLKAKLDPAAEPWWRPGMTGLAQIDVGDRTILWIWTHRLIDTLRLKLWW
jgi:RND family efflux transporter MFP subunit